MSSNCYGFALDIDFNVCPGMNNGKESTVFNWDGKHGITKQRIDELLNACKKDGLEEISVSEHKIAVFINEYVAGLDFHFYKLVNASWRHKLGANSEIKIVADCRAANQLLVGKEDPNGDLIVSQAFCGYLYRPKIFEFSLG
jgi:hypothetical protein